MLIHSYCCRPSGGVASRIEEEESEAGCPRLSRNDPKGRLFAKDYLDIVQRVEHRRFQEHNVARVCGPRPGKARGPRKFVKNGKL